MRKISTRSAMAVAVLGASWMLAAEWIATLAGDAKPPLHLVVVAAHWGGHALVQLLLIAFAAWIGAAARGVGRWRHPQPRPLLAAMLIAVAVLWPALQVGEGLASGEWISKQSWAALFSVGVAASLVLAAAMSTWLVVALAPGGPRARAAGFITAIAGLTSLVATWADGHAMRGLYLEFHLFANVLGAAAITCALWRLLIPQSWPHRLVPAAVGASCVIGGIFACLTMSPSTRAGLLLVSGTAANLYRLAPAAPEAHLRREIEALDLTSDSPGRGAETDRGGLVLPDPDRWNVLLVVVDTLRADALPPSRSIDAPLVPPEHTPFLNQWISRSFRFERAYAHSTQTHRSMPAMFRSVEVFEGADRIGDPLALWMENHGRIPVAVVNNYFLEPRFTLTQELLEGLHELEIYDKLEMDTQAQKTTQLLERVHGRPFFGWLHYYGMHAPGWDGRPLSKRDGSQRARYSLSIRWLDSQLEHLFAELTRLGIADHTIVVLTGDHGEGLGDNGIENHGPTVHEEEVRIPLVIDVPGFEGRLIDATVGNIDVLPTIADLLGLPRDGQHRGRSLLPLMAGIESPVRDYYFENMDGTIAGLVRGADKLVYNHRADAFYRYDLDADPQEDRSIHGADPLADAHLHSAMIRRNPGLFLDELQDSETLELIDRRLAEVDASAFTDELDFLLHVAALGRTDRAVDEGLRIFKTAGDDKVRLAVLRQLAPLNPAKFGNVLREHLRKIAGTREELKLVAALAEQKHGRVAPKEIAERIAAWVDAGVAADVEPWLRLTANWKRNPRVEFAPVLQKILLDNRFETLTPLVLRNIATLDREDPALAEIVTTYCAAEHSPTRALALGALGQVGVVSDAQTVDRGLADKDARVRQAALRALSSLLGKDSIPKIVAAARADLLLTVDAIALVSKWKTDESVEYLTWVSNDHYNHIVRKRAKKALKKLKGKGKKAAKKKGKKKKPKTVVDSAVE